MKDERRVNYSIWQLVDSGFPAGGFTHSGGLEAGVHQGQVTDAAGVCAFARQAVAQAGRSALPLVTSSTRSFPGSGLETLEARVRRDQLCGHYSPLFGAVLNVLGVDLLETQRLFLFLTGRCVGSAAVRLGLVGAYQAQELQAILSRDIDVVIEKCDRLQPLDVAQTAPLIDLCQSTHDRLYSRLFQS
jgi:urease accessory protein